MKKRILAAALCAAMVMSLTGCGKEETSAPANTNSGTVSTTSSAENTSTSTPTSTTSSTTSAPASAPTSSSENVSTASSDPASNATESKAEESGDILQEVADILGVEYDESSSKLVEEYNNQALEFSGLFNNHLGLVRPGTWGKILYDSLNSIFTGEYISSLDPSNDPSLNYTTEELQNHLRYCMFYGFDYLENPSLQLPSTVYQNFLNCSGKEGELYYVPIFEINLIKDITIIEETKDFGDSLQSQLTMTVDDGDCKHPKRTHATPAAIFDITTKVQRPIKAAEPFFLFIPFTIRNVNKLFSANTFYRRVREYEAEHGIAEPTYA